MPSDLYTIELLEAEGLSKPKFGENRKVSFKVDNDLKPTILTLPETDFLAKQTDKTIDIYVQRLPPNFSNTVKLGWHVTPISPHDQLDYFYERQRGTIEFKDGADEAALNFKLLQVPQKVKENQVKVVLEPPVGGRCTELLESEALVTIENDIPRPMVQLDLCESQVKQTSGDVSLPVSRSRFMGGRILIPWYLDVTNEHSYGMKIYSIHA